MTELRAHVVLQMYKEFADSRRKQMGSDILDILHGAVGVSGEAGELIDAVKKAWVYNKHLDKDNVAEEIGDIMFYIQMICNTMNLDVITILEGNMVKLKRRYPDGYSDQAAQTRADKLSDPVHSRISRSTED